MERQGVVAFVVTPQEDWVKAFRFANMLLRSGQSVLLVRCPADLVENPHVAPGSFVIPVGQSVGLFDQPGPDPEIVRRLANDVGVELEQLDSATSIVASPMALITVGLYGGGGAPFNQASIVAGCGFPIRFLSDSDILAGHLRDVDVLIMPGGGFRAMQGQLEPLGVAGCRAIADFVRHGGMYIGSCAGAYDCAVAPDAFVAACPAQKYLQLINARIWNDSTIDFGGLQSPGVGSVRVRNEQPEHPVMFGLPSEFEVVHYNGPIFDPLSESRIDGASLATGLAAFVGPGREFTPSERFAGDSVPDEETLLHRASVADRYSVVAGYFGAGRVVAFGSHPEFGFDLPMVEWSAPARMLANAVTWQATSTVPKVNGKVTFDVSNDDGLRSIPVGSALSTVPQAASGVTGYVRQLRAKGLEPLPSWMSPEYAMSLFGFEPVEIWRQSLDDIDEMCSSVSQRSMQLAARITDLVSTNCDYHLLYAIRQIDHWTLDDRPVEWRQDGGYHGILALLRIAAQMCEQAIATWDTTLGEPAGAYGYLHENPYHLVAGSYLAAVGCLAGATHLVRAMESELSMAVQLSGHGNLIETR